MRERYNNFYSRDYKEEGELWESCPLFTMLGAKAVIDYLLKQGQYTGKKPEELFDEFFIQGDPGYWGTKALYDSEIRKFLSCFNDDTSRYFVTPSGVNRILADININLLQYNERQFFSPTTVVEFTEEGIEELYRSTIKELSLSEQDVPLFKFVGNDPTLSKEILISYGESLIEGKSKFIFCACGHANIISYCIVDNVPYFFIIDSAGEDNSNEKFSRDLVLFQIDALKGLNVKIVTNTEIRQSDGTSCPLIAAEDLRTLYHHPELHYKLVQNLAPGKRCEYIYTFDSFPSQMLLVVQWRARKLSGPRSQEFIVDRDGEVGRLQDLLAKKYYNQEGYNEYLINLMDNFVSGSPTKGRDSFFSSVLDVQKFLPAFPINYLVHEYSGAVSAISSFFGNLLSMMDSTFFKSAGLHTMHVPEGYVDVPKDGHCFYHAVSLQLGGGLQTEELHQKAVNEVLVHPERYVGFADLNALINDELTVSDGNRAWAGNLMIQAMTNALCQPVTVNLFGLDGSPTGEAALAFVPVDCPDDPQKPTIIIGNIANMHFVAHE